MCAIFLALAGLAGLARAGAEIRVDAAAPAGEIRPLHGVNNGPLCRGETVDLAAWWKQLSVPFARLHDVDWPAGNVADMHAVFPDLRADASDPASYRFARTDDYIAAILAAGSGVVYRLGESIEHSRRKHHVRPPADVQQWARACVGIVRHYNLGWAGGMRAGIRHWEIWNEPENRPAMWTGSDEQFYDLYVTAGRLIKSHFPDLEVGGPSSGCQGEYKDGVLKATPFLEGLIACCKEKQAPMDFFSWHTYTDNPRLYGRRARAVRAWLDGHGLSKTRIHLNEWNYLPGDDWGGMLAKDAGLRRRWYQRQGGPEGAAFLAAVLCDLQDAPIDVANFYAGDNGDFGLFSPEGEPKKTFYAMKAFRMLLDCPRRVKAGLAGDAGASEGVGVCAGVNAQGTELALLAANCRGPDKITLRMQNLPWKGPSTWRLLTVTAQSNLDCVRSGTWEGPTLDIALDCPAPSVMLIQVASGMEKTKNAAE